MRIMKKCVSVMLALIVILTAAAVGVVPGTVKSVAASWNGYNYGGGTLYGSQSFLEAYGIDYDVYMKWLDDHDADSDNPDYYLGTPYVGEDHRNPHGDCDGAYGYYDVPGVEGMNCTGFVWHVLYKASVMSDAPEWKTDRIGVMAGMPGSWYDYDVYRVYFDSLEDAYDSGILEKGDVMWIYGTDDNHNAIFYGDNPHDWMYWDSAGEQNRYCEIHAIGDCRGLWVAKVSQPDYIELHMDTASGGNGTKFGTKYCVFNNKSAAQAAIGKPYSSAAWDARIGTIVLDSNGHGCLRTSSAPASSDLWSGNTPRTNHPYFYSGAKRVDSSETYYAVQWSNSPGVMKDNYVRTFTYSGKHTSSGYKIFRCYAPIQVNTPTMTSIKSLWNGIKMKWNAVRGAYKYRIYYKTAKGWNLMAETTSTSYLDQKVKRNNTYTYTLRCIDRYGNYISDYNHTGWKMAYTYVNTPQITKLESAPQGIRITCSALKNPVENNGTYYRFFRKNSKGNWVRVGQSSSNVFTDQTVSVNYSYTYTVRCVDKVGDLISNYNNKGWSHTFKGIGTPQVTSIESEPEGIRMTWDPVDGAVKYRVYCKNAKGGWTAYGDTANPGILITKVTPGTKYTFTVRCINNKCYGVSGFNTRGWSCTYKGIDTPQLTSAESEPEGIRLTWEPVEGAVKYRIYYKVPKGWEKLAETADTEYVDNSVMLHDSRTYTIRCVNSAGSYASDYNRVGKKAAYNGVPTPEISEIVSESEGLRIRWNVTDGVARYRLYRKDASGAWQMVNETAGGEYYDKNVSYNCTYTYTLRCVNSYPRYSSDFNRAGRAKTFTGVDTPQFTSVESEPEGIRLQWQAVEGAVKYRIYYRNDQGGWTKMADTAGTEYLDNTVMLHNSRTYTIRCINSAGYFASDFDRQGSVCTFDGVPTPVISEIINEPEGLRIRWNVTDGVAHYRLYRKDASGAWQMLKETAGSEYFDNSVNLNSTYTYTLRCVNSYPRYSSDFNKAGWAKTYTGVDMPQITALESTEDGVKITWNAVDGAYSYRVFRRIPNGWTLLKTIKGTEFTDTNVTPGTAYTYTVRCISSRSQYNSDYDREGTVTVYNPPEEPIAETGDAAKLQPDLTDE